MLPFAGIDLLRGGIPESVAVPVVPAVDDGGCLMRAFGLTRAESGVALALYRGQSPAEIAETRHASPHMVRARITAALSKCGVRRQAEPVGLVGRPR